MWDWGQLLKLIALIIEQTLICVFLGLILYAKKQVTRSAQKKLHFKFHFAQEISEM